MNIELYINMIFGSESRRIYRRIKDSVDSNELANGEVYYWEVASFYNSLLSSYLMFNEISDKEYLYVNKKLYGNKQNSSRKWGCKLEDVDSTRGSCGNKVVHAWSILIGNNLTSRYDYDVQIEIEGNEYLNDKPKLRGYLEGYIDFHRDIKTKRGKKQVELLSKNIIKISKSYEKTPDNNRT